MKLARNSFFQFWVTLLTVSSSLTLSIVVARQLGPDLYGTYAFFIWFLAFGAMLANLGLNAMSTKFISEFVGAEEPGKIRQVIRLAMSGRVVAALAVALMLTPMSLLFVGNGDGSNVFLYPALIAVAMVPFALFQGLQAILRGFQRYDYLAYVLFIVLPAKMFVAVLLLWLGQGIRQLFILEILVWTAAVALGFFFMRRAAHPYRTAPASGKLADRMPPVLRRQLVRYAGISMTLLLMDFVVNQRAENLVIAFYHTDAHVGFYNLAFAMTLYPMLLVPGVIGAVLLPAFSEQYGRGDTAKMVDTYAKASRYLMFLAFPIAVGGIVLARTIVDVLFGEGYSGVVLPAQILFVGAAAYAVSYSTTSIIFGTNRPKVELKLGLLAVPLIVVLSLILIPRYGATGAAMAHISNIVTLPVAIWYVSAKIKAPWPYADTARALAASLVMGGGVVLLARMLPAYYLLPVVIALAAAFYLLLLALFGALRSEDYEIGGRLLRRAGLARVSTWLAKAGTYRLGPSRGAGRHPADGA